MSRSDLAKGCAIFLCVVIAGWLSSVYVDRHLATREASIATKPADSACVDSEGSWKNWPWPNVPALSPKCPPER
jgi:hypothetical protein